MKELRRAIIKAELKRLRVNGDFKDWAAFCSQFNVTIREVKLVSAELEAEGF